MVNRGKNCLTFYVYAITKDWPCIHIRQHLVFTQWIQMLYPAHTTSLLEHMNYSGVGIFFIWPHAHGWYCLYTLKCMSLSASKKYSCCIQLPCKLIAVCGCTPVTQVSPHISYRYMHWEMNCCRQLFVGLWKYSYKHAYRVQKSVRMLYACLCEYWHILTCMWTQSLILKRW